MWRRIRSRSSMNEPKQEPEHQAAADEADPYLHEEEQATTTTTGEESNESGDAASHQWNATSILQSAARVSMLDDSAPSSNVSDDDESIEGGSHKEDGSVGDGSTEQSSPLSSLQKETPPAMPDIQDRKRFVGCLAAVLANAYDYDETDAFDDADNVTAENFNSHMDASESSQSSLTRQGSRRAQSEANLDSQGSFEYSDTGASDPGAAAPSNDQVRRNSRRSFLARRERTVRKSKTATSRHRKRRYDVLSDLLMSSADLMHIEKSQTRAFLPMLSALLKPRNRDGKELESAKQRRLARFRSSSSALSINKGEIEEEADKNPESEQSTSGYSAPVHSFSDGDSQDFLQFQYGRIDHLQPFLESLTPGSGFRCLALFLLQHLLHHTAGYDARIRHAIKLLGVLVIVRDMDQDPVDVLADDENEVGTSKAKSSQIDLVLLATRKFESLEHCIASNLLQLSRMQQAQNGNRPSPRRSDGSNASDQNRNSMVPTRGQVMRGLKIGGAAVVAGTLFAVTGGLAAPGIATGLAALASGTAAAGAATAAVAVLSSTVAVTTIFGVGGGSLAAYKMRRRTVGLTEFAFQKESCPQPGASEDEAELEEAELYSTICLSGWLRDQYDFQRPWGVTPSNPCLDDRVQLLERFYAIHSPEHVPKCRKILSKWRREEDRLWDLLRQKYGRDPDNLFPLEEGPRFQGSLTLEQQEIVSQLFIDLGHVDLQGCGADRPTPFERLQMSWKKSKLRNSQAEASSSSRIAADESLHLSTLTQEQSDVSTASSAFDNETQAAADTNEKGLFKDSKAMPAHISTVWDYHAHYGGEMYTVKWESHLLRDLCDSVADLAKDLVGGGAAQILKHTALAGLMSAMVLPYALVNAANMIDGTWTLAVERSDEAGKELAKCLLFSRAGHRPVTLVGYSFGARAVYSCLKELARFQEKWEDYKETGKVPPGGDYGMSAERFFKNMREPGSIVEDAILCGLPNHLSLNSWEVCRQVVAGRLVNCFSQSDLILSLMFQFKRLGLKPVCGTTPVDVNGVENIDVTDLVSGHQDYCLVMGKILERVHHGQPFQSRPTRLFIPQEPDGADPKEQQKHSSL